MVDLATTRWRPPAVVVYLLGLVGGLVGMLAATVEVLLPGWWLMLVLITPAIEEACKPVGLLFLLDKRPYWLRSRKQIVFMAVLGAVVFATLENLLFVYAYHPGGGLGFIIWRFVACTAIHVVASAVFGVGLAMMWRPRRRTSTLYPIGRGLRYYAVAVGIHAVFNAVLLFLHYIDVFRF